MATAGHSSKRGPPSDTSDAPDNKKRAAVSVDSNEAITEDEIQGTETPAAPPQPRNAFSALMAPKPKAKPTPSKPTSTSPSFPGRAGLGAYLANPAAFPASRVIFHTPSAVAIHDLFPKATVHTLLLPRSAQHNELHPFDALDDAAFLAQVRADAARLRGLAAKELQRLLGRYSMAEAARNAVLDGEAEPKEFDAEGTPVLPAGRDWEREIMVGVHSVPSMTHLHVHVLSRDMHSEKMKHKKHYLSFTTDFFVPLEDFPLAQDDRRRRQGHWPERPMLCFRCRRDYGNKFKELKEHLEVEFEAWRHE
ncbi:unnamed protein product [Discula destructiva]